MIVDKENLPKNECWEDIYQLHICYNNEEENCYISLINGQKEGSVWSQILTNTKPKQSLTFEFANPQGQTLAVFDKTGKNWLSPIKEALTNFNMRKGLLPYANFRIGINLGPDRNRTLLNKLLFAYINGQYAIKEN